MAGDLAVKGERLERGAAFPARRAWRRRRLAVDDRTEAIVPGRMVVRAAAYIIGPARNLDELAAVASLAGIAAHCHFERTATSMRPHDAQNFAAHLGNRRDPGQTGREE